MAGLKLCRNGTWRSSSGMKWELITNSRLCGITVPMPGIWVKCRSFLGCWHVCYGSSHVTLCVEGTLLSDLEPPTSSLNLLAFLLRFRLAIGFLESQSIMVSQHIFIFVSRSVSVFHSMAPSGLFQFVGTTVRKQPPTTVVFGESN